MKTITEIISNFAVSLTPSIDPIAKDSGVVTYVDLGKESPWPNPLIIGAAATVIFILLFLLFIKFDWVDEHLEKIAIPVIAIATFSAIMWTWTYEEKFEMNVQPIQEQIAEQGITMSDKELEESIKWSTKKMRTEIVKHDGELVNFNIVSKRDGTDDEGEYLVTWSITEITPGQ